MINNNSSKNSNFTQSITELNQSLNGNVLIAEGSGAATKYYIQAGADTASKKLLGKPKRIKVYDNRQMSGSWQSFWFDTPFAKDDATIADFGISIRSFNTKNQANVGYTFSYSYSGKKIYATTNTEFGNASAPYADLYYYE